MSCREAVWRPIDAHRGLIVNIVQAIDRSHKFTRLKVLDINGNLITML